MALSELHFNIAFHWTKCVSSVDPRVAAEVVRVYADVVIDKPCGGTLALNSWNILRCMVSVDEPAGGASCGSGGV